MTNKQEDTFDLVVIGGGVNGTGIAADAAGRGLNVLLCEQSDLASATSSNSSKLIHGGLRYLEHYEFRLVKEALAEREVLLKNAPHIMWPLRFRLPHRPHLRPAWMIRIGLFLYDNLAKRVSLKGSNGFRFGEDSPLIPEITKGFEYSDGWVDDARLVVLNAKAAQQHGARIHTYTQCTHAVRKNTHWHITLQASDGDASIVRAKAVVNASGPWVSKLFDKIEQTETPQSIRLVKGSHIIVPKIHEQEHAYILQNEDGRIVFVLPYENDFSLIGTTDVEFNGNPKDAAIDQDEIDYLIEITNQHFVHKIARKDVVHSYSGVRPLLEDESSDAQAVTRDYTMEIDTTKDQDNPLPLLSIFGGKITTYRKLSEAAVNKLSPYFSNMSETWTKEVFLPGGNFTSQAQLANRLKSNYPWLPLNIVNRWVKTYGTACFDILAEKTILNDLGIDFGHGLFEAEVNYLIKHEWAITAEDILWRRTKLGLRFSDVEKAILDAFLTRGHVAINAA